MVAQAAMEGRGGARVRAGLVKSPAKPLEALGTRCVKHEFSQSGGCSGISEALQRQGQRVLEVPGRLLQEREACLRRW
ncbi:hypothetical protein D7X32_32015 [Corallococcus carmarthensis]|uniref:Uncharacterized protein n=1 Tax=Corallococcus carmarthensis TaxID=2316728 RepID=A0A3A8JPC8_9BACT|nr:hypothetical protein D7X32_32015 [Corallococcus carmarthensis]